MFYFIILIVMASCIYAYVKTYQMVHLTYNISINLFLKSKESVVCVKVSQRWLETVHNAQLLCLQRGTDPVAPQCPWSLWLSPSRARESICSKHHFSSCEVTCSFYSSHLRSVVGGSACYLPPSLQGTFLCQHLTLTDTGGREAIGSFERLQGLAVDYVKAFSLCNHLRSVHVGKKKPFKK